MLSYKKRKLHVLKYINKNHIIYLTFLFNDMYIILGLEQYMKSIYSSIFTVTHNTHVIVVHYLI